jgi:hypothetical protein
MSGRLFFFKKKGEKFFHVSGFVFLSLAAFLKGLNTKADKQHSGMYSGQTEINTNQNVSDLFRTRQPA